jgi:aminopeptidase N/predicted negative regulator of RcsB-dependent stress response
LRTIRFLLATLSLFLLAAIPAPAQAPRSYPFRATNYDVEVTLHPEDQTISARVRVDFIAEAVSKTVVVELHPDLRLTAVHAPGGPPMNFERDRNSPLLLTVALPEVVAPGHTAAVTFEYGGPVSNEDDSPTKGLRFASVDKTSAYLLLPARWFPLTNYPSNRYTGTFKINVPDTFAVVGTGKAEGPTMIAASGKAGGRAEYVFHCDQAAPVGTFVAGALQLTPVHIQGFTIPVYTPPAQVSTANDYGELVSQAISYFAEPFSPIEPVPNPTIAQLPDGTLAGYYAPGLVLISARQWTTKPNTRLMAQLAAHEWWGDHVLAASAADVWLTDGLSRYSEAMFAEQTDGAAALHRVLDDYAVGALMYEDVTPIAQASRLELYSENYRSVVLDKGAMVFHMLRAQIGDEPFESLLREFFKKYDGKTASLADFEKMAATKTPAPAKGQPAVNLAAFFSQWLNSTGVPEFKLDYVVYRTPKGFKVVGKIRQELDTFRMPVEVKVDTEGNPENKKILVTGTTTEFQIDTFGRPKPNGVTVDATNNLLKSSPKLRVHAAVARGEGLAEIGKYYEAIEEYQKALDLQSSNSLAHFRMAEAMFYQKNYNAAANSFRAALGGNLDPKWIEVWSHIYIGKIYDLLGQRERAVNEYGLAQHTNDDTAGAQEELAKFLKKPYTGDTSVDAAAAPGAAAPATAAAPPAKPADDPASSDKPVLKKRPPEK